MRIDSMDPANRVRIALRLRFWMLLAAGILFLSPAHADTARQETLIPDGLSAGLDYLMETVESADPQPFDMSRIAEILKFVRADKNGAALYYSDDRFDAAAAYYESDLRVDLARLLELSYNPDLPSFLLMPSSVRLSYWSEIEGRDQPLPRLWRLLPDLERPVVVKGVEHIVNTPDIFSGAYYRYDLKRTLILFKYQGRRIFVSISKQADTSDVGRRGLVLGSDEQWNYLYSDRTGLSKAGLGWVSSYMYDSFCVSIYDEIEPGRPLVRSGIFKWLRAGWAKLNVVNKNHIYAGLDRYGKTFKEIVEHPLLPSTADLEQSFKTIENLSEQELKSRVKDHFLALKQNYAADDRVPSEWVNDILANEQYVSRLTGAEMKSILVVETLKKMLGKEPVVRRSARNS